MNRRKFLQVMGALGATTSVGSTAAAGPVRPRLKISHHRIRWSGPGPLRVVQLTDLHVGWNTPIDLLRQAVAYARAVQPHLVVMTGDYLNRSLKHMATLRWLVSGLPGPVVATLGNHDHWSGADVITRMLTKQGIAVLSNQSLLTRTRRGALQVVGVDDGATGHADAERAGAGIARPDRCLWLTHAPDTADAIVSHGGRLILAGHTHGGQIHIPGVTPTIARLGGQRYLSGWYPLASGRLYVSPGLGSSVLRWRAGLRAAPEVAVIDLLRRRA